MAPAVLFGSLDQPVHLLFRQIFSHAPTNCYIFYRRSPIMGALIFHENCPPVHCHCYTFKQKCNSINAVRNRYLRGLGLQEIVGTSGDLFLTSINRSECHCFHTVLSLARPRCFHGVLSPWGAPLLWTGNWRSNAVKH